MKDRTTPSQDEASYAENAISNPSDNQSDHTHIDHGDTVVMAGGQKAASKPSDVRRTTHT